MKGCVQGYGNYEELTSSGVDPTELFDDIENSAKSPELVSSDFILEEFDDETNQQDTMIKSSDHVQLLPVEKAKRRVGHTKPEGNVNADNFGVKFDAVLEEMSLTTGPSLHSLVSAIPEEHQITETKVCDSVIKIIITYELCLYLHQS